jgi:hypothetical protein
MYLGQLTANVQPMCFAAVHFRSLSHCSSLQESLPTLVRLYHFYYGYYWRDFHCRRTARIDNLSGCVGKEAILEEAAVVLGF